MITVRCKVCNKEITSHPTQSKCCGCTNMMTVTGDKVSAVDLTKIVMVKSNKETKQTGILSSEDLMYQEERRKRKVRKLDFEIK